MVIITKSGVYNSCYLYELSVKVKMSLARRTAACYNLDTKNRKHGLRKESAEFENTAEKPHENDPAPTKQSE